MGICESIGFCEAKTSDNLIIQGNMNGRPKDVSLSQSKLIHKQMENSVCKIEKGDVSGTGFICQIPNNNKISSALITCNHVLGKNDLSLGKTVELNFNNKIHHIKIDKNRKSYTDIKYDVTIIELKPNEFKIDDLLKLDDNIFLDSNMNDLYKNQAIYVISYPYGLEPKYAIDLIKGIDVNNCQIKHFCTTFEGSSGGPIINLDNGCVIGIHLGQNKADTFNIGLLLKSPINEFNKISSNISQKKLNEIILKLDTDNEFSAGFLMDSLLNQKEKERQKIYFLDNSEFFDFHEEHFHDNLKELNNENTKVYISCFYLVETIGTKFRR